MKKLIFLSILGLTIPVLAGCNNNVDRIQSLALHLTNLDGTEITTTVGDHMNGLSACTSSAWKEQGDAVLFYCYNNSAGAMEAYQATVTKRPRERIAYIQRMQKATQGELEQLQRKISETKDPSKKLRLSEEIQRKRDMINDDETTLSKVNNYIESIKAEQLAFVFRVSSSEEGEQQGYQFSRPVLEAEMGENKVTFRPATDDVGLIKGLGFAEAITSGSYYDDQWL